MRSLNDSNIEVSTQGFEITSSNMLKKLKRKRGKIDLKKKTENFNRKLGFIKKKLAVSSVLSTLPNKVNFLRNIGDEIE